MSFTTTALIVTWVVLALFGLALAGIVRQIHFLAAGRGIRRNPIGPPIGSLAPALDGYAYAKERNTLLLFVEADCSSCEAVLAEYASLAEANDRLSPEFVTIFAGAANGYRPTSVRVLSDGAESFASFQIPVTPFAVLVDAGGLVEKAAPIGSTGVLHDFIDVAEGEQE